MMNEIKRRISGSIAPDGLIKVDRLLSTVTRGNHAYKCGVTRLNDVVIRSETTGKVFVLPMQVIVDMAIAEGIDIEDTPPSPAAVGSAA